MSPLFDLTLRGTVVGLAVLILDSAVRRTRGSTRRLWWCLVPFAFLVPLRIDLLPRAAFLPQALALLPAIVGPQPGTLTGPSPSAGGLHLLFVGWLLGVVAFLGYAVLQTIRANRRWSTERLSTDHRLLEVLEACKAELGVTAPIGVVVSGSVPTPAIHGWLRPRILLPASFAGSSGEEELRAVFLHELAHFRALDIPFHWLLLLACAVHWFNPVAHLARMGWARFREEAADEAAVRCMGAGAGADYGACLLRAIRRAQGAPVPFGALSIAETTQHLKRRLKMISDYPGAGRRLALAATFTLAATVFVLAKTAMASDTKPEDAKVEAAANAAVWLKEIDSGKYDESWKDASAYFRGKVAMEQWVQMNHSVREPLGKCLARKEMSALFQKDPSGPGGVFHGEIVTLQYASSYDNLKSAVDTVSFMRDTDGAWRAAGYYIRPG